MYYTESICQDGFKPSRFESDGRITLRGEDVSFHTVSEDNVFYGTDGKAIASLYSYSYFRTNVENVEERPVIFAFNGGPGSSSKYVHAGFLAPKRIHYSEPLDRPSSLPPYEVIDNPECLLDIADIVIIDPVGVGYGVLLDETKKDEFYGIEADAEALLAFIEKWCARYGRFNSPKYMIGESYGCTRAATAAGIASMGGKDHSYGVRFDGIVFIGNTVAPFKYFCDGLTVPYAVLGFPSYAAVNWYHNHPSDQTVEEFFSEAKAFADHDYLLALYKGEELTGEERAEIKRKISYYTGVSDEYLEKHALEIDQDSFRGEVLKGKGLAVGRCDARFTRPLYNPPLAEEDAKHGFYDDAVMDRYDSYFYSVMTGVIAPMLNINLERSYIPSKKMWPNWKLECDGGNTGERLRDAMNTTFGMRAFFANGYYDICTESGPIYYSLSHSGLPRERCFVKNYPSGHMIYIGEDNIKELTEDIRKFVLCLDMNMK